MTRPVIASGSEATQMVDQKGMRSIRCTSIIIISWIASLALAMTVGIILTPHTPHPNTRLSFPFAITAGKSRWPKRG
jgi:hypothetical protein